MKEVPPSILQTQRFWDAFYVNDRVAEFRRRLYIEVYGEEYPAELGTDGYITMSELRQMAEALHVGPGDKIADMGCGRGGPGQWIARATGATLVGIDISGRWGEGRASRTRPPRREDADGSRRGPMNLRVNQKLTHFYCLSIACSPRPAYKVRPSKAHNSDSNT